MSDEHQPNEVLETQAVPDSAAPKLPPEPVPEPASDPISEPTPEQDITSASSHLAQVEVGAPEHPETGNVSEADAQSQPSDVTVPSVVRIADIEKAKKKKKKERPQRAAVGPDIGAFLVKAFNMVRERAWLAGGIFAVLLLIFLFLPPVSLGSRLTSGGGYTALNAESPSTTHPDGLTVGIDPASESKLGVKLDSVPRVDFMDEATKEFESARAALPQHLSPKSPYYLLETRGNSKEPAPAQLKVVIPNESEPWETLDLYTWDGEVWRWVPSRLDRDAEILLADVAALPESVMVMQSGMIQQKIIAEVKGVPPAEVEPVLTDADLIGMLIGTMGGLTGDATQLPLATASSNPVLVPSVRNWLPGREPNWALVHDMLSIEADRASHVENLVGLVEGGGYEGLVVDYRNVQSEDRVAYVGFITELQAALHAKDLWLALTVDTPKHITGDAWDTGGYDWRALGLVADQVRVLMPIDPQAYAPGGMAEQLLEWGISQVDRYKLYPIYSTLSTDGQQTLTLNDVLAPLGTVRAAQPLTESVSPGTALAFQLGTASVDMDPNTGVGKLVFGDTNLWLGTPQWLRSRLDLVARYHLGGAVVRDILDSGNLPNLVPAIADYKAQAETTTNAGMPEVTWQLSGPEGQLSQVSTPLTQSNFAWTAPEITGVYRIAAKVAGVDKGNLQVMVASARPSLTGTLATAADSEEDEETEEEDVLDSDDDETAADLKAAFVADVTVPDNTRFEKEEKFTKTWRLRNAGSADWPEDTVLVFAEGEQMAEAGEVEVGAVKAGATVDVSVDMMAPNSDGSFKSVWELKAGDKKITGGGMYTLIKAGDPAVATTDAPAPVVAPSSSGGFELGGHVRDLALPYASQMHYAGMNWTKVQIRYGEDPAWIVNIAHSNGFKIQLSALGNPGMVTEAGFEQKFADWLAGVAKTGADAIEVWNEPNIDREWQSGYISPQAYTNLLCTSYNAIKSANPGSAVISAAPAPTGYFGGCGPNGCDDQPWMEGLFNAGAANCMDYIGAHHNAGATSPSARSGHPAGGTHHSWYFLPQTELYYNIFQGTRKIFYTEMGYASQEGLETFSDQFAWARGINNSQQAAWLSEAVQLGINTGMVRCIIVWNIDFTRYGYDPQDGYAIMRPGGACPACDALHNILGTR